MYEQFTNNWERYRETRKAVADIFPGRQLSARLIHCLANAKFNSWQDIEKRTTKDFLQIDNFGRKCLKELQEHCLVVKGYTIPAGAVGHTNIGKDWWPFETKTILYVKVARVALKSDAFNEDEKAAISKIFRIRPAKVV